MVRQILIRATKPAFRLQQRSISYTAARMAAGDTGAPRAGGQASADAFNKREEASENLYVKQKEREKLLELRKKIAEQQGHLKELEKHLDDIAQSSGGEKN